MSETINARNQVGIDKALGYAVTLAWEEFKAIRPRSIRVEYVCEPGAPLNHLSVWSSRAGGYQDLVFDYGTWMSSTRPHAAHFTDGHPEGLAKTLDFIMQHQNQFTRPPDAGRHGLVLIYPPEGDDRTEAAMWIRGIDALEDETSGKLAPKRPQKRLEDHRQSQGQEASSQKNRQKRPDEPAGTVFDATRYSECDPVEAPAKTGSAGYFALRYAWPE